MQDNSKKIENISQYCHDLTNERRVNFNYGKKLGWIHIVLKTKAKIRILRKELDQDYQMDTPKSQMKKHPTARIPYTAQLQIHEAFRSNN